MAEDAGAKTLLILDDERLWRERAGKIFERAGYRVILVSHYDEAMRVIDSEQPLDLLITDVVMPTVHGFALARMAVVRRPDLKILYVSAHAGRLPHYEEHFALGKVVEKTGDPADLLPDIAELVSQP
jgi:DNA-binding NtrC family response regulator